jgi:DNA-binding transcriptional LysR family regulator
MDLRRLRTFVTVAELGSVSKAALRLRVAQSALSRQIIDLEKELELKLFDRVGRRLVLTKEGEQLVENCRGVLGNVALLVEQAHHLRGGDAGLLKVAASPQVIESLLPTFLRGYASKFPDVQVKLSEAVGRDQLTLLERGDVDISIGLLGALRAESHFTSYELPAVEILAACQPSLELGDRAAIEITQLARYPLLLLDSSYVFRKSFDAACRLAGVEPNVVIESRAPHTLLALAEAGHGVAIVQTAVPISRYTLRIVRITHHGKPIRLPMAAIWDKRRTLPRYADDFCKLLGDHMRKVFPIAQPSSDVRGRRHPSKRSQAKTR